MKTLLKLKVLVLTIMMSLPLVSPQPAMASAYGCAGGNPNYGPSNYCVNLNGSGTYVNWVRGTWNSSAYVCNSTITAEFFDANWRWYETRTSAKAWGCAAGSGGATIGIYAHKRPGFMCSTLKYTNGTHGAPWRYMSVCHRIS